MSCASVAEPKPADCSPIHGHEGGSGPGLLRDRHDSDHQQTSDQPTQAPAGQVMQQPGAVVGRSRDRPGAAAEGADAGQAVRAYFAPGATHAPHHVPAEWVDKYRGKFDQGWDEVREQTPARQKELGVIPAEAELTPALARAAVRHAWSLRPIRRCSDHGARPDGAPEQKWAVRLDHLGRVGQAGTRR